MCSLGNWPEKKAKCATLAHKVHHNFFFVSSYHCVDYQDDATNWSSKHNDSIPRMQEIQCSFLHVQAELFAESLKDENIYFVHAFETAINWGCGLVVWHLLSIALRAVLSWRRFWVRFPATPHCFCSVADCKYFLCSKSICCQTSADYILAIQNVWMRKSRTWAAGKRGSNMICVSS